MRPVPEPVLDEAQRWAGVAQALPAQHQYPVQRVGSTPPWATLRLLAVEAKVLKQKCILYLS